MLKEGTKVSFVTGEGETLSGKIEGWDGEVYTIRTSSGEHRFSEPDSVKELQQKDDTDSPENKWNTMNQNERLNFLNRHGFSSKYYNYSYKNLTTRQKKLLSNRTKSKRKRPIAFKRTKGTKHAPKVSGVKGPGKGWHKQSLRHSKASVKGWKGRRR